MTTPLINTFTSSTISTPSSTGAQSAYTLSTSGANTYCLEYASTAPKVTTVFNLNGSYSSNTWSAVDVNSSTTSNTQGLGVSNDGSTLFYAPPSQQNLYKITNGNGNYFFNPANTLTSTGQTSYRLYCQCVSDNGYAVFSPTYAAPTSALYVYTISGGVLTYSSTLTTVYKYPIAKCNGNTLIVSSSDGGQNVDVSQYTYSSGSFGSHLTIAAYISAHGPTSGTQNLGLSLAVMSGGNLLLSFAIVDFINGGSSVQYYLFGYVYNGSSWVLVTGSQSTDSLSPSTNSAIYKTSTSDPNISFCLSIYHASAGITQSAYVNSSALSIVYYTISGSGSSWSASSSATGTITQSANSPSTAYGTWGFLNAIYDGTDATYPYLHIVSPQADGGGSSGAAYGGAMRSYSWNGSSWVSSLDWLINSLNGGICQSSDYFGYAEYAYDSCCNSCCVYNNKFVISSGTGVLQQFSFVKSASGLKVTFDAPEIVPVSRTNPTAGVGLAVSNNGNYISGGINSTPKKIFCIQRSAASSSSSTVATGQTFGTISGKISQGVSATYVYAADFTNGTIYRIRTSDGNLTQIYNTSVVTSANDTCIWTDPISGNEFLFFNYYTGAVYSVGYLNLTTWNGSSLGSVSQCVFSGSALPTFNLRNFYISISSAAGYNLLFIGYTNSSTIVYQTTLSVSGGVPNLNYNGTAKYTIPSETKLLNALTSTNQGGYNDGNLRLFTINSDGSTNTMYKIYNASGTGVLNLTSGVGGDLHCKALNGKSVIVIREEKLELLNTHPKGYVPLHSDEVRTRIDVDGFSLKNDYDSFAKNRMTQEQIDLAITNIDDSYFKRVYITLTKGDVEKKYVIDGLTFLIEDEDDDGGERSDEFIHFSEYINYAPGEAPDDIKTKFIIPHVIGRRKFTITTCDYEVECDLCRENRIHVNDLHLTFGGPRDPTTFAGLSISGDVYSPLE